MLKTNNLDCSSDSSDYGSDDCNNAYERIDLGEADTENFTQFKLTVSESQLVINVDGTEYFNRDISYWDNLLSYFKAGVYNQFENGTGTVEFKNLSYTNSNNDGYNWDIDQWKLTIPASKDTWYGSGGDTAAELEPEHCNSSKDLFSNEADVWHDDANVSYFNVETERMHFRTNMGYGTTTENTSYIRSEMRELFNAESFGSCSTSTNDTSWGLQDSATGAGTHQLSSTLAIEEYPNISGQDPKVIVGQVHGWEIKQALVKVLWEGESKPVRVILNQDFYKDNEKCGSESADIAEPIDADCDEWSFSVDMGTYTANTDWSYVIRLDADGIYLQTQYADGSEPVSRTLEWGASYSDTNDGTITLSDKWTDSDVAYYFKAGIYPQFKTDDAYNGEIFDVSFAEVDINHY